MLYSNVQVQNCICMSPLQVLYPFPTHVILHPAPFLHTYSCTNLLWSMCYPVHQVSSSHSCHPLPSLQRSNYTRKMTLLHFKAWPKNGHPPLSSVTLMLQVMERMAKGREASAEQQGPIVVMCKWARIHSCTVALLHVSVMAVSTSYAQFLAFSSMFL